MKFLIQIAAFKDDDETVPEFVYVTSADSLDEVLSDVREAVEGLQGPPRADVSLQTDALNHFIASLPKDCRNSFNLMGVFEMFQLTKENINQMDTPHRREAIIREVRRRDRTG